jgi:hypothetical protein
MLKSAIARSVTIVVAAVLVAGVAAFSALAVPEANAKPLVVLAHAKGDRLPVRVRGPACSLRSWPYYDRNCQFDLRRPANEARAVRLIALR